MARRTVLWLTGVACICLVAVIWTLATVLKQVVFSDLHYDEPLVLTWVCNGCYVLQLPLFLAGRALGLVKSIPWRRRQHHGPEGGEDLLNCWESPSPSHGAPSEARGADAGASAAEAGTSVAEAVIAGLAIAPVWFASQWTYSAGVARTSVTSSTVISTTSVVWTLLASWMFLGEKLTPVKLLGIAACMAGNVATLWGNDIESGQRDHFSGDVLCLVAAMLYATYTTMLMVLTTEDTCINLVFGAVGVAMLVFASPVVLLLRGDAVRTMSSEIFGLLIFNGVFDNVLSQYAWAKGVQWTSPTSATVGLSLTIPLSMVADVVRRKPLTVWSFVAAALVVLGFVLVTLSSSPGRDGDGVKARRPAAAMPADQADGGSLSEPLSPSDARMHPEGNTETFAQPAFGVRPSIRDTTDAGKANAEILSPS